MQTQLNSDQIITEIRMAEDSLTHFLRSGEILKGVAMHQNQMDYRNIWNGEIKKFDELFAQINKGIEKGLVSIDYQIRSRDYKIIDYKNVLETMIATETTKMKDGMVNTSGLTAITILWQKSKNKWLLGYLHASELP